MTSFLPRTVYALLLHHGSFLEIRQHPAGQAKLRGGQGPDTLPLELNAQSFAYARTGDGSTARALSLVSGYVRDVTAPFVSCYLRPPDVTDVVC